MDAADHLIVRMAEGLAGWLSYQQAARRHAMYSEYLIYPPIYHVAAGRGWTTEPQKALRETARRSIDFLFRRRADTALQWAAGAAALEVKFVKARRTFGGKIENDLAKLCSARKEFAERDDFEDYGELSVFQMIVGQETPLLGACEKQKLPKLSEQVRGILDPTSIKADTSLGWARSGHGSGNWKFQVVVLREQEWWQECTHGSDQSEDEPDLFPEAHEADEEREDQYEAPRQL